MKVLPFIADSASDAVEQIRTRLGPDAVVINVRRVAPDGLSRLWKKSKMEVLAYRPSESETSTVAPSESLQAELSAIKEKVMSESRGQAGGPSIPGGNEWPVETILEKSGLTPLTVRTLMEEVKSKYGQQARSSLAEEMLLVRRTLIQLWRKPPVYQERFSGCHVFIGPSGSGKTTALCKWMAQTVLVQNRKPKIYRLDGRVANVAENLSVYGEIFGLEVHRSFSGSDGLKEGDICFLDLPGVDFQDQEAIAGLEKTLRQFPQLHVHLVLNAAYELPLLMSQARAFPKIPVEDLILTHLDEEMHWGKLWNLALGTNFPIRFLNLGQNIPGEFCAATPEMILSRQFRP